MTRASIAMAVYNGEDYVSEQIESILKMMGEDDELIISYEESLDSSLDIINRYCKSDPRVSLFIDDGHSVESNFNNSVSHCSGKYIFLSDQDDVWIDDKINKMIDYFERHEKCVVLVCDGYITTKNLRIVAGLFDAMKTSNSAVRNFIKGSYNGCQMAFRSCIKSEVWPVSEKPPLAHDLWLGVMGSRYGEVHLLHKKLILHRIHELNYSNNSKLSNIGVIKNRLWFLLQLICRIRKNKNNKFN